MGEPVATGYAVETRINFVGDELKPGQRCSAKFSYLADDPYAVHMKIYTNRGPVVWTFARELLHAGMTERSGLGDVTIEPYRSLHGDYVLITLSSPDGSATFELARCVAANFMRRTYRIVGAGREYEHIDVDSWVKGLLERD